MPITTLDHVQLAMPPGGEEKARHFYRDLLGLSEIAKPLNLVIRGGCWFERGSVKVHLGVESDFHPARKAHPAFLVQDLSNLIQQLTDGGFDAITDEPLEGYERVYVSDPFGTASSCWSSNSDSLRSLEDSASLDYHRLQFPRRVAIGSIASATWLVQ